MCPKLFVCFPTVGTNEGDRDAAALGAGQQRRPAPAVLHDQPRGVGRPLRPRLRLLLPGQAPARRRPRRGVGDEPTRTRHFGLTPLNQKYLLSGSKSPLHHAHPYLKGHFLKDNEKYFFHSHSHYTLEVN